MHVCPDSSVQQVNARWRRTMGVMVVHIEITAHSGLATPPIAVVPQAQDAQPQGRPDERPTLRLIR